MLQTVLDNPWLLGALAFACLALGVGIGLLAGRWCLTRAARQRGAADDAGTAFLKNMSHDVLTPMNAVLGYTQIALSQDPQPQVRSCLEKIDKSARHLLTLMGDVRTISRIEGGRAWYQPEPVDITSVVDDALDITQSLLSGRVLKLEIHRKPPEYPYVRADRALLREVLVKILGNAVKFTGDGGTIRFFSECCSDGGQGRMVVRFRIEDTGIGMSQEFLGHLFEKFAQEDPAARTQYRGSGLGLSIVKRYVDMMGGTIRVDSQKGRGSSFTLELPLERVPKGEIPKPLPPGARTDLTGVRVLLAEDNDLNAEIATIQLEEAGLIVTRARNGGDLLVRFTGDPPGTYNVILMDIMMPEMDGLQATRAIRTLTNRPDGRTIPIIALTANAFAEDVEACLNAGMNAHLPKPIVISQVLETIGRYL